MFLSQCRQCRQEIQQTELSFLRPPSQRTKSRYFNLENLINWGHKILLSEEKNDFSWIDNRYVIDVETLGELAFILNVNQLKKIWSLPVKNYENAEKLRATLFRKLGKQISSEKREAILQELGRMILIIPLATLNFTVDLIKQALESITSVDLQTWEKQLFGPSMLSKRKMVFSSSVQHCHH